MGRRTWTLILVLLFLLGASFIGSQIYVYHKCLEAIEKIVLPNTQFGIGKFNLQFHKSTLRLSNISIVNKLEKLNIGVLEIQMHPSSFSKEEILITRVRIRGFSCTAETSSDYIFSHFFKSNFAMSNASVPLRIKELLVSDMGASNKRLNNKKNIKIPRIRRHNIKSRAAKLNGSMDFLVHVIYFVLQSSLSGSQFDSGFRKDKTTSADQIKVEKSQEESLQDSIFRSMRNVVKFVLGNI